MYAERETANLASNHDVETAISYDVKIARPIYHTSTSNGKIVNEADKIVIAGEAKYHRLE